MARLEEAKKELMSQVVYSIGQSKRLGGQHVGIEHLPIIAKHEELEIEISIGYFNQNYKNKEFARLLMELAIDDLIK